MKTATANRVFVYGTLKKGHGNHRRLKEGKATFVGEAKSLPEFTMLHLGGFPGIVRDGSTEISGEVYAVDDETLDSLDALEGHPSFYERQPLTVVMDGNQVEVEGYVLPESWAKRATPIESGVWGKR